MKIKYPILTLIIFAFPITASAFSDLPESHHYFHALSYLQYEGVIEGYPDGTVRPDNDINRAELVKIMIEGLNLQTNDTHKNCFPDVKEDWYAKYVCFAKEKNWIEGYPDETFKPEQNVNKAEALKIIFNAYGIDQVTPTGNLFADTPAEEWYAPFLQAAKNKNLIEETGTNFSPEQFRTRGEVAEMVARILQIQYMGDPVFNEWIRAEFQTFMLVNKLRADNGVTSNLALNPALTRAARAHSQDMAEVIGDMSHEGSDGSQASDRIRAELPPDSNVGTGENVGRGTVSVSRSIYQAILDIHNNFFMIEPDDEPNHRTTILSKSLNFTQIGIGVYEKDGYMYFTEDFITDNV